MAECTTAAFSAVARQHRIGVGLGGSAGGGAPGRAASQASGWILTTRATSSLSDSRRGGS